MSKKMQCPMCDTELTWNPTNPHYKSAEDTTHIYVCPECPFVGFEYLSQKNTNELDAFLEKKVRLCVGENLGLMDYDALREHVGHKIVLNDVTSFQTGEELELEIRCEHPDCEGCEPLLSIDNPHK